MTSQRQCTGLSFVNAWLACIIAQRTNYEDRCRITLCLMDTIGHVALAVITGTITLVTYNSVESLLFISRSDTRRFYAYSILKWVVRLKNIGHQNNSFRNYRQGNISHWEPASFLSKKMLIIGWYGKARMCCQTLCFCFYILVFTLMLPCIEICCYCRKRFILMKDEIVGRVTKILV